jgi:hypothetical protein
MEGKGGESEGKRGRGNSNGVEKGREDRIPKTWKGKDMTRGRRPRPRRTSREEYHQLEVRMAFISILYGHYLLRMAFISIYMATTCYLDTHDTSYGLGLAFTFLVCHFEFATSRVPEAGWPSLVTDGGIAPNNRPGSRPVTFSRPCSPDARSHALSRERKEFRQGRAWTRQCRGRRRRG